MDPIKLRAYNLSAVDVQRALASQNLTTPGGSVDTGPQAITLRIQGRVENVAALERLVLRDEAGSSVRMGDVAVVEDGEEELTSIAAYDGERTVTLSVRKQSGTNTVQVVDTVLKRLEEVKRSLPSDIKLEVIRDNSASIRTGVGAVKEHLVVGALLAAVVVLLFLGSGRSTLIAAISIPISIVGTFALMWMQGFTLNMLTLLALALAVGIVIDDAIVVLENIVRYVEEKGVKTLPGGGAGHARDRPAGLGHHLVPDGGVRAGGLRRRHSWALPEELRLHDGLCRRCFDVRELRAHADHGCAPAQTGRAREESPGAAWWTGSTGRSSAFT